MPIPLSRLFLPSAAAAALAFAPSAQTPGSVREARVLASEAQTAARAPRVDMQAEIERFEADRGSLERFWSVPSSPRRAARLLEFARTARAELDALDFDSLDSEGRIDWLLLAIEIDGYARRLRDAQARAAECAALLPFNDALAALCEARQRVEPAAPEETAAELDRLARAVAEATRAARAAPQHPTAAQAQRAANTTDELARALEEALEFRRGYDPLFSWWTQQPGQALASALAEHARALREEFGKAPAADALGVTGQPVGRAALLAELREALIAYTPEELFEIGAREMDWCRAELEKAAADMGLGKDWKAALERVKQAHVAPGEQPALVRSLAEEAIAFVEQRELVSVPALAKETWRMTMLSPERQLANPFFLGGEEIQVAFPTDAMSHEQKQMSMRGNNRYFGRATVFHEVIPGHRLQQFMNERWRPYRAPFSTPFWTEGWALWWELHLWELGYPRNPEERIGMLFWRMHRCARIRFSLGFHLGELNAQQCVELLVNEVGHERNNAEGEVRRSFNGGYGPLYQCAYLIGGLQLRSLYGEAVASGKLSERDFHDAVLQGGNMPIELVRARVLGLPLAREFEARWRFYELAR